MPACEPEWSDALSALRDGEVDANERAVATRHVRACPACEEHLARLCALGDRLRGLRDVPVPSRLERRARLLPRPPRRRAPWVALLSVAAALVVVQAWPRGWSPALADELERHHYKAFSQSSPCDFTSSDPKAVAAWLRSSVGYDVEVPAVPGATLLGARRCRLGNVLTASLLYRKDGQALTLFVPRDGDPAAAAIATEALRSPRCARGRMGEHICARAAATGARIAVAELDDATLLDALNR